MTLAPDSPGVDGGEDASCAVDDVLGQPRPADGNGDGTAVCDLGAFELRP